MSGFHWLASYPKSGNTWLRLALGSLAGGGRPPDFASGDKFAQIASDRTAFDLLLDVDSADLTADEAADLRPRFYEIDARRAAAPQLRKVHDAWTLTPSGEPLFPPAVTLGAICIVRDPRDVAVSFAHHMGVDIDRAVAFMARPDAALAAGGRHGALQLRQTLLCWSGHVRSWRDAPGRPALLLRYEDMLADAEGALARAAAYLGWAAAPETVAQAVAATRFDALRAAEERHGFTEKPRPAGRFFRRGIAGGWRDTLTAEQASRIEDRHGAVMAELGYR
jgi:hypothetical protein